VLRLLRRTKIVATLGPATDTDRAVAALAAAGMDGARLNFSHGTRAQHAARIRRVREAQVGAGRPLALIADLQGPKLRVGDLDAPIVLERGAEAVVSTPAAARPGDIPVSPPVIADVLQPGHDVLIDDGRIRLRVVAVAGGRARCTVVNGGTVRSRKGVNLPGVELPIPSLTPKDRADLAFALEHDVDYVALSFVRSAADVVELRALVDAAGSSADIIAKIEKPEAVADLAAILEAADAVMVARGDLGVEIGPAEVPLVQKRIIAAALAAGKPVITATQMLESMISSPEPTRAEASDVANAILDGTSAVMLSGETAVGEYPIEAVDVMARIAHTVEPSLGYRPQHTAPPGVRFGGIEPSVGDAMCVAACDLAETLHAKALVVPTFTGRTASQIARLRPHLPILAFTHQQHALQQMALEWGVVPLWIPPCDTVDELWGYGVDAARSSGLVAPGDRVVLIAGTSVNRPGANDIIRVDVV
jgi:pyruvate kinase